MPFRIACLLVLAALAAPADVVDLSSSLDPTRSERLVGEWTYDVWNAGMPPVEGSMTIQGKREGEGYLLETSTQVPDGERGLLFSGEALALGKDLVPTGYARTNHVGETEVSRLEMSWGASGVAVTVGKKEITLVAATLPDMVLPHWLVLLPLDPAKEYRTAVLSFAGGPHAAPAMLRCDGTREVWGKAFARWSLRLTHEDATTEMKWWVDADGVVAFRCGSYEGTRKGTAAAEFPLDGDLSPDVTIRMTPEAADAKVVVRQFDFEDAGYRRGAVVAMRTNYSVDDCAHGRVMDLQKGDRVVALLRRFSLGNPTQAGDEWCVTLALSLPGLEAGKSYDLGAGQGEGILHYGSQGPQVELISRQATGQVKVVKVEGPTIEMELSLTFEGQMAGTNVGPCRFDVQGRVQAELGE